MASASSLAHFNSASRGAGGERGLETIEIDPQFAEGLGFREGDVVCNFTRECRFTLSLVCW